MPQVSVWGNASIFLCSGAWNELKIDLERVLSTLHTPFWALVLISTCGQYPVTFFTTFCSKKRHFWVFSPFLQKKSKVAQNIVQIEKLPADFFDCLHFSSIILQSQPFSSHIDDSSYISISVIFDHISRVLHSSDTRCRNSHVFFKITKMDR